MRWLALLALLCVGVAHAARQDVTFVLAQDNPGHAFFDSAQAYYRARPALAGTLVTSARSLAEVREFLQRSPLRGDAPWGRVRLVAHGSQWQGLRVPLFAGGTLATPQAVENALAQQEFPPLPAAVLDRDSELQVESCGLGKRPRFLRQLGQLFGSGDGLRVTANSGYVWFRRVRGEGGRIDSVREELDYRAEVLPGATALSSIQRERLLRSWRGSEAAPEIITVPVHIDVAAPQHERVQPPEALQALRSYGLRWSQLQWRIEQGRLHGRALLVVAAADVRAADRRNLLSGGGRAASGRAAGRHQQGQREYADHGEGQRHLDQGADQHAQPGAYAHFGRALERRAGDELADQGAEEGPEDQARQAEEKADHGAHGRAEQGPGAGADALGPEQAGDHVGGNRQRAQNAEYAKRPGPDVDEIVVPGGQEHAGEHQRNAGQGRQHGAEQPDDDHDRSQQIKRDFHSRGPCMDGWPRQPMLRCRDGA